ncbi:hypothetical protein Poras_0519 [Porphyromonas asaccharolytica DSM 20707]|uniref:Uncharacterized protein n=1 Tax=Porphyromonas asaccharolytica (strain ATCC 25260 / DSM 20707 / BCRC 10618 / CCUG 7834 / JCM 6326 / LMG 13178 / VPI 4198 / B440) TaxID=879243 RepID=F4KNK2_PORAD|nr:hypothetical protein Poras_0519 [Porphyromonas asaccharolytica DSM 20707]
MHLFFRTFQCQVQHGYKCRKKLHGEFYSLVFFAAHIPVSGATHKDQRGIDECTIYNNVSPLPSNL